MVDLQVVAVQGGEYQLVTSVHHTKVESGSVKSLENKLETSSNLLRNVGTMFVFF